MNKQDINYVKWHQNQGFPSLYFEPNWFLGACMTSLTRAMMAAIDSNKTLIIKGEWKPCQPNSGWEYYFNIPEPEYIKEKPQRPERGDDLRSAINNYFYNPKKWVNDLCQDASDSIVLHIRHTDKILDGEGKYVPVSYFIEKAKEIRDIINCNKLLLITDSSKAVEEVKRTDFDIDIFGGIMDSNPSERYKKGNPVPLTLEAMDGINRFKTAKYLIGANWSCFFKLGYYLRTGLDTFSFGENLRFNQ
jgi:hypothetical protein